MNTFLHYFVIYLAAFGAAVIIGHSKISLPFRVFLAPPSDVLRPFPGSRFLCELLECVLCFGVWEGIFLVLAGVLHFSDATLLQSLVLGSLTVAASNLLLGRLGGVV